MIQKAKAGLILSSGLLSMADGSDCTFAIDHEQQDLCHTHLGFAGTCSFIIVVNSSALNMLCMLPVAHATMAT